MLGLRNPTVSFTKGLAMTQILKQELVDFQGPPFPFELLDMHALTYARYDATIDGYHYDQSVRMMSAVGLASMICNKTDDFR